MTTSNVSPVSALSAASRVSIGASVEVAGRRRGGRSLRRLLLLNGSPQMDEADEVLVGAHADGVEPLARTQYPGSPPIAGKALRVGRKQDDVGRDPGGQEVLLVLDLVAGLRGRRDDQGRCAV